MATPGLHHIVHAVRDLDAAADTYARLGFMVGAPNRHPWGTCNRVVQFDGSYIEVLGVAEPDKIPLGTVRSFSFGAFNRDFLANHEGLSMVALESRDARADAEAFRTAGIGDFDVFDFTREGRRPDGTVVRLAFSLVFAADPQAPEAGFFTCQEYHPESFWNPASQVHPNGAAAMAGLIVVAEEPERHRAFLSAPTGGAEMRTAAAGITVTMARGTIQVIDPAAFRSQLGIAPPDTARGPRLAALRFAVRDIAASIGALKRADVTAQVRMGRIVVGPDVAMGATMMLEPG